MASAPENLYWFWFWWLLTLGLVGWQVGQALFNVRKALGFPAIAGLMWGYFYVVLPYQVVVNDPGAIGARILGLAEFASFAAYASLLAGWHWGVGGNPQDTRPASQSEGFDYAKLWYCGLLLMAIGLVGDYTFSSSGRNLEQTSAYWYLLFHLSYPGLSLCIAAMVLSPRHRTLLNIAIVVGLAFPVCFKYLAGARRGPTFVAIIASSFTYFLSRPRLPKPVLVFGVLGLAGAVLLVLVASRNTLYQEDGTWQKTYQTVTLGDAMVERGKKTGDNEFYNHCVQIDANITTGLYQYGTAHLAMLVHWIPRRLWPEKPNRGDGFFPAALEHSAGDEISNLGHGGAIAAVADSFNNYGWLLPIYWLGLGWILAKVYVQAVYRNNLRWKLHYVGILCASHWLIAQSLAEAFVPAVIYQLAYYGVFRLSGVRTARAPRLPKPARRITRVTSEAPPAA